VFYRGFCVCANYRPWICVQTSFRRHFLTFCCGGVSIGKEACALF
jgi:hypothetical protein